MTGPAPDPAPQPRARGVGALLTAVVAFAATVAAGEVALRQSQLGKKLAHESLYTAKGDAYSEGPGTDLLVVGDSRILHGFDPRAAEAVLSVEGGLRASAWNAGLSGAPPMAHLAWVRRALTHPRKRPRVVVLSISPYMFSSRIAHDPSRESLTTLYRFTDVPAAFRAGAPADDLALIASGGLFASVRYRPKLLGVLLRGENCCEQPWAGERGFLANPEVDAATQDARARGRAMGYRTEMWRPDAHFGNEQVGYFRESLRALRAAGIATVVMNSPSASQIGEVAYGPRSIYVEHMAFVRAQAAAYGAVFADAEHNPAVDDPDYTDGDHLGANGAARFSAWLTHTYALPRLGGPLRDRPATCTTRFDFEDAALPGWRVPASFADPVRAQGRRMQWPIVGHRGARFFDTFGPSMDDARGTAVSPPFRIDRASVRLRVGGGSKEALAVALVVDGRTVAQARGRDDETLREVVWDVQAFIGREAVLEIRDEATGPWGHLLVDDVAVCEGSAPAPPNPSAAQNPR